MGWKFWTWPRQIRVLRRALDVANQDNAHLRAALEKRLKASPEHQERQRRGLHRAQL